MSPITLTKPKDVRNAWLIWLGLAVVMMGIALAKPGERSVFPEFYQGARHWLDGAGLYGDPGRIHGFLYLPHAAILLTPLACLPAGVSEAVWRGVCVGLFAWGVFKLARLAGRASNTEMFPLMTLLAIPMTLDSARNGQMNLPLAALMMMATADLADRR